MKQTVNFYDFERAFADHGRSEQFTYEALRVLFDFLEEMEADTGEEMELDVIALCCDFNEDTWEDIADNYSIALDAMNDLDGENLVMEHLENNTIIAGITNNTIIYQAF